MSCPQSQEKLSSVRTCQFLKIIFMLLFSWSPISKSGWDVHWWKNLVASPFLNVHQNPLYCCWESVSLQAVLNYLLHANHQHVTHPETAAACIRSWKWELVLLISFVQESVLTESTIFGCNWVLWCWSWKACLSLSGWYWWNIQVAVDIFLKLFPMWCLHQVELDPDNRNLNQKILSPSLD